MLFLLLCFWTSSSSDISTYLLNGDSHYNIDNANSSFAYEQYRLAYLLSEQLGHQDSSRIALRKILRIFTLNDTNLKQWEHYLNALKRLSSSPKDFEWYEYFSLRLTLQKEYRESNFFSREIDVWESSFSKAKELNDLELLVRWKSMHAIYLELTICDKESAAMTYLENLQLIENDSSLFYLKFSNHANLGKVYQESGSLIKAIKNYKIALSEKSSSQLNQNLVRIYTWLSECYFAKNELDSALFYHKKAYNNYLDFEKITHATAISELEEKYQNEKLSNELTQESLKRNQLYITSLSLGSLLGISLIGIWGIRRFNRLKRKSLEQEIQESEQRGQLAAINAKLDGAENERKRVANALHDGISSHLSAAAIQLQVLQSGSGQVIQQSTQKIKSLIGLASEQSRQLSHELYPPILIREGLLKAIESLAANYSSTALEMVVDAMACTSVIPQEYDTKLYYIITELIQNVIKHSGANYCKITFSCGVDELHVEMRDNGRGIHESDIGLGLQSIAARVKSLKGRFKYENGADGGLSSTLVIPLKVSVNTTHQSDA